MLSQDLKNLSKWSTQGISSILPEYQSDFREKHSTISAATLILDNLFSAIDKKKHSAAIFIDLSKGFDTVDHSLLLKSPQNIGFDLMPTNWIRNE